MEDINRLWTALLHGVAESVSYHTLGLAWHDGNGYEMASATAISFRGRDFVATAGHVIEGWPNDILLLSRGEEPLRIRSGAEKHVDWARAKPASPARVVERYVSGALDDLALLVLAPSRPLELLRFYDLDDTAASPIVGTKIMVYGHPEERIEEVVRPRQRPRVVSSPVAQLSIVLEPSSYGIANFDSDHHFLLQFERSSGPEVLTHPRGLSGGGCWIAPPWKEGAVWDPRTIGLVGIQVAWYPSQRIQKVTRVERLITLLARAT